MSEKIKLVYVAGSGRSGSTILGNILGQVNGFFPVGEFAYVWRRLANGGACSCGASFAECEVWGPTIKEAFGGPERVDARAMDRVQRTSTRPRHLPLMLAPGGRRLLESRWTREYKENIEKLYRAVLRTTGDRLIVDFSKLPLYGRVLETIPGVDLYVVHLVRDPRAVAYSWLRKKKSVPSGKPAYMPQHHPVESALEWDLCNVAAEKFWGPLPERYLMLRYEDFVGDPRGSVRRILRLVGEEPASLPFVSERGVGLGANHNVGGNPNRFTTGAVELRPDEEWALRMGEGDRRLVTSLTLPFLARFGYRASPAETPP